MQVVNVLGYHINVEMPLHVHDGAVSGIRLGGDEFASSLIVKLMDEGGVSGKTVGRCHVHHGIFVPEAAGVSESGDATLRAHAGTR